MRAQKYEDLFVHMNLVKLILAGTKHSMQSIL